MPLAIISSTHYPPPHTIKQPLQLSIFAPTHPINRPAFSNCVGCAVVLLKHNRLRCNRLQHARPLLLPQRCCLQAQYVSPTVRYHRLWGCLADVLLHIISYLSPRSSLSTFSSSSSSSSSFSSHAIPSFSSSSKTFPPKRIVGLVLGIARQYKLRRCLSTNKWIVVLRSSTICQSLRLRYAPELLLECDLCCPRFVWNNSVLSLSLVPPRSICRRLESKV